MNIRTGILAACLLALAALAGVQSYRLQAERAAHATTKLTAAQTRVAQGLAYADALVDAKAISEQRAVKAQESADEATRQNTRLAADLRAARDESARLRLALAQYTAPRAASPGASAADPDPAADGQGDGGGAPARMLAELLGRFDGFAQASGQYADRLAIAGSDCERRYDALTEDVK